MNVVDSKTSRGHCYHHVGQNVQLKYVNWFQEKLILLVNFVYSTDIQGDQTGIDHTSRHFVEEQKIHHG